MTTKQKELAQEWFAGIYCGDPSVVDRLAADSVVSSYPVFKRVFGVEALRGRDEVRKFAARFVTKWSEGTVVFRDIIAENNSVVLLWSFTARNIGALADDRPPTNEFHTWGGITLIRFDAEGRIIEEVGEESAPGPFERVHS